MIVTSSGKVKVIDKPQSKPVGPNNRKISPSANAVYNAAHEYADTDETDNSIHHTLGRGPRQAAPGKDTDDRLKSNAERLTELENFDAKFQRGIGQVTIVAAATPVGTVVSFPVPFPVGVIPVVVVTVRTTAVGTKHIAGSTPTNADFLVTALNDTGTGLVGFSYIAVIP